METIFLFSASFSPYPQFLHGCYGNSPVRVKTWSKGKWKNGSNCSQRLWFIIDTQCHDINLINVFFFYLVSLCCCLWKREKKMCFHHQCNMCAQLWRAFAVVVQPWCVCCRYYSCIHTSTTSPAPFRLQPKMKTSYSGFFLGEVK